MKKDEEAEKKPTRRVSRGQKKGEAREKEMYMILVLRGKARQERL